MSQVVQQEALTRVLIEKGMFTREEFLNMVRVVDKEMKKKEGLANGSLCSFLQGFRT
jgi:hypothetical protein